MRTRALWAPAGLVGLLLAASTAGGSAPVKRYTLPAGPTSLASPGVLTVSLPAHWAVFTYAKYGTTRATDPAHRAPGSFVPGVYWIATTRLMPAETTLDDVRRQHALHGPQELYGPNSVVQYQVGDTFLDLPVGRVWRQSLQAVPPGSRGWAARAIERVYWLDRGVVRNAKTGGEQRLFSTFMVQCRHQWCDAHTGQFEAVMRSIRLTS